MLSGYFDDSREDGSVFILAGYLANDQKWMDFTTRWDQALTMNRPKWDEFKMKEVNLNNPDEVLRAKYHYRVIEEFLPDGFCLAIPTKPYRKVMDELNVEEKFRNPYFLAWLTLISFFRNLKVYYGWKNSLDIYFDNQTEEKTVMQMWYELSEKYPGESPFKNAPMFRDSKEFPALQAADLLAWWARKNWVEYGTFRNNKWLFPWPSRESGPHYTFLEMDEDGIRKHISNSLNLTGS